MRQGKPSVTWSLLGMDKCESARFTTLNTEVQQHCAFDFELLSPLFENAARQIKDLRDEQSCKLKRDRSPEPHERRTTSRSATYLFYGRACRIVGTHMPFPLK